MSNSQIQIEKYSLKPPPTLKPFDQVLQEFHQWIRDTSGWEAHESSASLFPAFFREERIRTERVSEEWEVTFRDYSTVWPLRLRKVAEDALSLKEVAEEISKKIGLPTEKLPEIKEINDREAEIRLFYLCDSIEIARHIRKAFASE
jgi:hypothetical protein